MSEIIQRTLSIIKPDAVRRHLIGNIITRIEAARFTVIGTQMLILRRAQAEEFYKEHVNEKFYPDLVLYMISAPVLILALEGSDAIKRYRQLIGSTDPKLAAPGTIRSDYGTSKAHNAVHGSDSIESAERELTFFFAKDILL